MKSLFLSLVLALSMCTALPAAHAAGTTPTTVSAVKVHNDFSFVVWSQDEWGNEVLYNADALHDTVEQTLQQMGATNISVMVEGEPNQIMENPMVSVSFDSVRLPSASMTGTALSASWQHVSLKGDDNGLAIQGILNGVQSHFEIQNLQGNADNGMDGQYPYDFEFNTLFAQ